MQRSLIILFLLFLFNCKLKAQFEDSIRNSLSYPPHFLIKLDSRNGFITNQNIKTLGLKVGITYHKRLSFGIGYNQLITKVEKNNYYDNHYPYLLNLKLHYANLSLFLEYAYYAEKRWQISIPVQFSFGSAHYTDQYDRKLYQGAVITYEPGIAAEYNLFNFFGLGLGIGYRLALYKNPDIPDHFTAPTYQLKLDLYPGVFYRDIFKKNRNSK